MNEIALSSTEERALKFLGQGVGPEQVAMALGITPSAISQMLAQEHFSKLVTEARCINLTAHSERDLKADSIEDKLLAKLDGLVPLMFKPGEVVNALSKVNALKRRGASSHEAITSQQTVVTLNIPVQILNQFTKDSNNQVIKAGEQTLITVQSGSMQSLLQAKKERENVHELGVLQAPAG